MRASCSAWLSVLPSPSSSPICSASHNRNAQAVNAVAHDGEDYGFEARIGGKLAVEEGYGDGICIVGWWVHDKAVADEVVAQDDAAWVGELYRPLQVTYVIDL